MLLKDKTVIVTGGNSGIGEAIVLAAAAEGANIVIDYVVHPEQTSSLIGRVEAAGGRPLALKRTSARSRICTRWSERPSTRSGGWMC